MAVHIWNIFFSSTSYSTSTLLNDFMQREIKEYTLKKLLFSVENKRVGKKYVIEVGFIDRIFFFLTIAKMTLLYLLCEFDSGTFFPPLQSEPGYCDGFGEK